MCGIHVGECDFRRVFSGPLGISVIAESLNQTVKTRFALTRNLILLQLLMLECGLSQSVSPDTANRIDSTFLPREVFQYSPVSYLNLRFSVAICRSC